MESMAITRFRQYLRIKTVQPDPDYAGCLDFFKSYASELNLQHEIIHMVPNKPIHILTWTGQDPSLPCLMLNSHIDVVPVSRDQWTHDPFAADQLPNGNIYARGSQDMKCVGIGYLEAIRLMKEQGIRQPRRTILVTFVPDEEIGGHDGMEKWVLTDHFKSLNVGFVLDEGLPHPDDAYKVYYGERAPWWIRIKTTGNAGHGSQFIEPNATLKLMRVLSKFIAFRASEKMKLDLGTKEHGCPLTIGDVTSVNITMLKAGVQANVVPDTAEACVDMRVAPSVDLKKLNNQIHAWAAEEGASLEFIQQFWSNRCTPLTVDNLWWQGLQEVASKRGIRLEPEIFPAATDSRYVRQAGYDALGISPFRFTPVLLHNHDEFLNDKIFLEGIEFYKELLIKWVG